jgi:hypothetical protein
MSGLSWYEDLGDATQCIAVDGDVTHRITWRRGKLILEDHDIEAEQALVALGGERCPCLDISELFVSPPPLHDIVQTGPPRSTKTMRALRRLRPQPNVQFQQLSQGVPAAMHSRLRKDLEEHFVRQQTLSVLQLIDGDLRRRLLSASAVAATRRGVGGYPDDRIGLTRFFADEIAPGVEWSLRGARRNLPAGAKVDFHLHLLPNDEDDPTVEGVVSRGGGSVHIAVQPRWLADVWAHDLTLVDDNPVLAVRERNSVDTAWVTVICWSRARFELTEPRLEPLFITRDETGFWHSATDRRV